MSFCQFFRKSLQICEGRVQYETSDLVIGIGVHQRSRSTHTSSPNTYTTHCTKSSQILEDAVDISSLIESQGDILSFRKPAASEVKSKHCDISGDEIVHDSGSG